MLDERAVAATIGSTPESITTIRSGRNNVAARVVAGGRTFFVKQYFRHEGDPRDRLGTEFALLSFLWANGIRCVAEPISMDSHVGIGVYEFVEGKPLTAAGREEGMALASLLEDMHDLRSAPGAAALPIASDAAFSLTDYFARLDTRLERVRNGAPEARTFVEKEAGPTLDALRVWVNRRAPELGIEPNEATPSGTLSPGDIGLHNAIRREDGSLAFVDFEYGGWDDAAHVLASACIPPGVPLPEDAHLPVLRSLVERFGGAEQLVARVRLIYPLLALKWSLILLNELVEVDRDRRRYAGVLDDDATALRLERAHAEVERARRSIAPESFLKELRA